MRGASSACGCGSPVRCRSCASSSVHPPPVAPTSPRSATRSRLFLFFVVSLASALLAREMVVARARQMAHTAELEHAVFAELREVDRIKSEFMMLASHELRTPPTKINAWLALMQDAGDHLPQQARQ